jgi:hypothetical protein
VYPVEGHLADDRVTLLRQSPVHIAEFDETERGFV